MKAQYAKRNSKGQFGMMYTLSFCKKKGITKEKHLAKGQFGMMEHLLLSVIILMIIVASMFFFFSFESTKKQGEAFKDDIHKIILDSILLSKSPMLTKNSLMFDDSKLAGFTGAYQKDGCEQVKKLIGEACVTIDKILIAEDKNDCDPANFAQTGRDECNSWTLCRETCLRLQTTKNKALSIPVNIYRKISDRMDLGVLTVRIPG